jgi:hypothetical protein
MPHPSPTRTPILSSNLSRRSLLGLTLALGGASVLNWRPAQARQTASGGWDTSILHRAPSIAETISDEMTTIATFADLERQSIAAGVTRPPRDSGEEAIMPWLNAMYALALPGDLGPFVLMPEARQFSGFGIEDVYQTADIGDPPNMVALYQGVFDRDGVLSAWSEAGYREIESGDVAIWSIAEDGSFDASNPVQRIFIARHNNAAMIGDDLIIFAGTLDRLRDAVAAATGEAEGLADHSAIAPVLAATPPLATGALLPGSSIMTSPINAMSGGDAGAVASAIASQIAAPQMPPVRLALVGVTGGGPYPSRETALGTGTPVPTPELARLEIALLTYSEDEARQAIEVAGQRLETAGSQMTGQPYNEMFASWDLSVAEDGPVARVSLELGEAWPRIWADLLYARDYGFIG